MDQTSGRSAGVVQLQDHVISRPGRCRQCSSLSGRGSTPRIPDWSCDDYDYGRASSETVRWSFTGRGTSRTDPTLGSLTSLKEPYGALTRKSLFIYIVSSSFLRGDEFLLVFAPVMTFARLHILVLGLVMTPIVCQPPGRSHSNGSCVHSDGIIQMMVEALRNQFPSEQLRTFAKSGFSAPVLSRSSFADYS
jgi:hypothetical protein